MPDLCGENGVCTDASGIAPPTLSWTDEIADL